MAPQAWTSAWKFCLESWMGLYMQKKCSRYRKQLLIGPQGRKTARQTSSRPCNGGPAGLGPPGSVRWCPTAQHQLRPSPHLRGIRDVSWRGKGVGESDLIGPMRLRVPHWVGLGPCGCTGRGGSTGLVWLHRPQWVGLGLCGCRGP